MILLVWLDLLRVTLAGVVLGLAVGWIVGRRPSHINRLRPTFWRAAMRKMKRKQWVRIITIALWVTAASLIISRVVETLVYQAGIPLVNIADYPFIYLPLPILSICSTQA